MIRASKSSTLTLMRPAMNLTGSLRKRLTKTRRRQDRSSDINISIQVRDPCNKLASTRVYCSALVQASVGPTMPAAWHNFDAPVPPGAALPPPAACDSSRPTASLAASLPSLANAPAPAVNLASESEATSQKPIKLLAGLLATDTRDVIP